MDALTEILDTPRLTLRQVALSDSSFFVRLLNDRAWLENIGDRGVRSAADAEVYISNNIRAHYQTYGYGLYAVQLRAQAIPIGLCGLLKRDFLPAPDLGFALLPEYVGEGYACEAARGLLMHAERNLGITRLYAVVKRGNHRSISLLERLGFRHQGPSVLPDGEEIELYAIS